LELPDEDDRHVLAAAIKINALCMLCYKDAPFRIGYNKRKIPSPFLANVLFC
jgi:hypothetical protein